MTVRLHTVSPYFLPTQSRRVDVCEILLYRPHKRDPIVYGYVGLTNPRAICYMTLFSPSFL